MVFIQNPPQQEPYNAPKPTYLWNTRGKLVKLTDKKEIEKVLLNEWRRPTSDELLRFKVGDYNPIYDKGDNLNHNYTIGARISVPKTDNLLRIIIL